MVGVVGFEPTTYSSQSCRAARLRYAPVVLEIELHCVGFGFACQYVFCEEVELVRGGKLLQDPPQADWMVQGGNECGNISQKGRQKECRREYMCFFPGSYR